MMKQVKTGLLLTTAMVIVFGAISVRAAEPSSLTRVQWLKKIGTSVTSAEVLRDTLAQVPPADKVEFTQRILKAVTRMPVSPEERAAAFVKTSCACIASVNGDAKVNVIAEIFAGVPIEHLPLVTEELAKRFDQEYNKLSDEQYEKIASDVLRAAIVRNAQTDAPSVRDTFVILAFLRGSKTPGLQEKLLALLPDDRMRNLALSWIPPALKDRNYDALLAAADVDSVPMSYEEVLSLVGHANLDRLLADLNSGAPLDSTARWFTDGSSSSWFVQGPTDFGINTVPVGYDNQGTDVRRSRGGGDSKTICGCVDPAAERRAKRPKSLQ